MDRIPTLVEIHLALWAVTSIPLGFAGLVFVLPGLGFVTGAILLGLSGALVVYVVGLARRERRAWLVGLLFHAVLVLASPLYIDAWPTWLALPFALANVYSAVVLLAHRRFWTAETTTPEPQPAG
jgi:hypothetical protein